MAGFLALILKWWALFFGGVLGACVLGALFCKGMDKLRKLRRAGLAVALVAIWAVIHGGTKNILARFSADEGVTVTAAEFTKATNDVDCTYLTYSYTGTDAALPLWVRQSVSNEWAHLGAEWYYDDRIYANGTNTVCWFVNPPDATNVVPYAMYWIGDNPPPVEIEESGGVEIVNFFMSAQGVMITYAVDGSVLHGKVGALGIEMSQTNNVWNTVHATNVTETVTNTFTRSGFFVDKTTRWRVRMEVEQ